MQRNELKMKTDDIISHLPEEASWDDLMQQIYVRQKIEKGLAAADAGKIYSTDEVRKQFKSSK